ncbi:protein kinase domain-containing protein [Saccharopolyspora sp. 5N708]|uniref:protein kinase domain-containing protein n=1 Tax=Saccharopolyspora sp. 5N708 TaxID=3457424 RepID=UPI003FD57C96
MCTGRLISGRYRLTEHIGSGGNGAVWRANDEELGRNVAIKHALSQHSEQGAERVGRMRREARVLAQVNHPNVVTLFDVVADSGEWLLVMEYLPVPDLAQHGTLPPARVARLGAQLAAGLAAVHAEGLVHRDIKPGNVLVTVDDVAKLSDFGVSRAVHADVTLTDTGLLSGTPGFISPEVANGTEPTAASDVFSLGATLFAAVEGVSPFGDSKNPHVLLRRAAEGDVSAPHQAGPLAAALSALLRVDPAKRPTAAEAASMLADIAAGAGTETEPGRRRGGIAVTALISATVVGVLALGALLATNLFPGSTDRAAQPGSASVVGDPRTADPCALTNPVALARFGETELDVDYGNFNRCDVIVRSGDSEVDIEVRLTTTEALLGRVEKIGALDVVREPEESGECARTLALPDSRTWVAISAEQEGEGPADLCGMAETAAVSAAEVLSRGEIPRRPAAESASLINVDACALLDPAGLSRFPGVDAIRPQVDFGNWTCRWNSTTSSASLRLIFERNQPLTASDGQPRQLAGRQAFVTPGSFGDDSCEVGIVHRGYPGEDGKPMVELLLVVVNGPQPIDELCRLATDLAEPAAAKLPR